MFPYKKRKVFKSSRSAQKKRKQFAKRFGTLATLLLVLFIGLAWSSWLPDLTIERVVVRNNTTVPEEDVRTYIEERLSGGYLNIFSRANVFLLQPSVIEKELLERFRKIKNIDVSRDSLRSVVVEINERKPYYLWCPTVDKGNIPQTCYFLDIDGFTFAAAPYFSGHVYFEFRDKLKNATNPIGTYFLPEEEFKPLISLRNSLRALDLHPNEMVIDEHGDYRFVLPSGTHIIFNPAQDFDLLFNNLLATFDTEQFKGKDIERVSLEYIDLRFKNKVYYRFK